MRATSNSLFTSLSPQYPTALTLSFTQPLARGLRFDLPRRQIEVAKKNLSLTDAQFRQRAIETARLAGFEMPEVTHLLVEVDYGEYEGRTSAEIRAQRPEWDLFAEGTPGGESLKDAATRCQRLIDDIRPEDGGGDVLLFAHGHILRVLSVTYLGLPPAQARCLSLDAAAVSILGHEHWWRAISLWNATT